MAISAAARNARPSAFRPGSVSPKSSRARSTGRKWSCRPRTRVSSFCRAASTLSQPSEHLLRDSTDRLLQEIYNHYDYIIIDSSPVLAADDTTSLAPKIDATLFVVRLSYTSARLTKKSLELLYNRQVNVPGVILNYVDTSLPEYYYYQYSEYYNTPVANEERAECARCHQERKASA